MMIKFKIKLLRSTMIVAEAEGIVEHSLDDLGPEDAMAIITIERSLERLLGLRVHIEQVQP